jgi:hypothetical protein
MHSVRYVPGSSTTSRQTTRSTTNRLPSWLELSKRKNAIPGCLLLGGRRRLQRAEYRQRPGT